ncbi:MAG: epoxyqueuosine reductase [Desulfosarcinaceae bacterium]|nr:epoxyqueuosine reductase [Desulfosarcinaceae bacterium]
MAPATNCGKKWVQELIQDFIADSPENRLHTEDDEVTWEGALVGFAAGHDPIWQQYKEYVGAFHWTPWELFNQHRPETNVGAAQLTVISWILPQRRFVRTSNRQATQYPSEAWARTRIYGEAFNTALRRHLVDCLERAGHPAVAPMLVPNWTVVQSQRFSYASSWSERHAAHAAGLGTFGLCDGLITASGKAMRAGSVVANLTLEATPRPYATHRAYCLFFAEGTCGKCIERCPVGAISKAGHDKERCRQHLARTRRYVAETYHFEGYGCGLCQVGIPCEARIPVKAARDALARGELPPPPPPLA